MAPALAKAVSNSRVGWAADGYEIHYVGNSVKPSYMFKRGTWPTAPGGVFDGSYNEDFEFVKGFSDLDECNGAAVNGTYK